MLLWDIFIFNNQLIGYVTKLSPPKHFQNYNDYCNLILALIHFTFPLLYANIPSIIKPILKYMRTDCNRKSYNTHYYYDDHYYSYSFWSCLYYMYFYVHISVKG